MKPRLRIKYHAKEQKGPHLKESRELGVTVGDVACTRKGSSKYFLVIMLVCAKHTFIGRMFKPESESKSSSEPCF